MSLQRENNSNQNRVENGTILVYDKPEENVQPKFVLVPAKRVDSSRAAELSPQNVSPFFNFRGDPEIWKNILSGAIQNLE